MWIMYRESVGGANRYEKHAEMGSGAMPFESELAFTKKFVRG